MAAAFEAGAGFPAIALEMFIRSMIASGFTLWAIWVIYNQFKMVVTEQLSIGQWVFNCITTVIVLTMILIIIAL